MGFWLTPEAEADLDAIWLYLAEKSESIEIANRLIDSIADRLWLLGEQPYMGRRRDEDLRPALRSFTVGEYVVLYRIDGVDAVILHVLHGSRDIEGFLKA
jgi:toxin ParE1/3/4